MIRMHRRAAITALTIAALVAAIAMPAAAAQPATRYVALGDSLAWGDGASVPSETGYVGLLADYFAGTPHGGAKQAMNLAIRGETTSSILAGQLGAGMAAIADPGTDTRVVTLSIGGNDLLDLLNEPTDPCVANPVSVECQALVGAALVGVANRMPVIMGSLAFALSTDPGGAEVYVLTLYNPFGGTGSPFEAPIDVALLGSDGQINCGATDPTAFGLNDIVACTALFFGATVVDGHAAIGDRALELTHIGDPGFNIHPNDAGYEAIAKAHRRTG